MRRLILAVFALGIAPRAFSAMSYTLSGSASNGHFGMQTHESRAGSASVEYGLTKQLEVGISHRQALSTQHGYKEVEDANGKRTVSFRTDARTVTNAATMTYMLFENAPAVPYVFGGVAHHTVYAKGVEAGETSTFSEPSLGPQAGLGIAVRVSKQFMLRVSYTVSPGTVVPDPAKPAETTTKVNSYAQLGISWRPN